MRNYVKVRIAFKEVRYAGELRAIVSSIDSRLTPILEMAIASSISLELLAELVFCFCIRCGDGEVSDLQISNLQISSWLFC